ncbi:hypothetical protein KBD49_07485 [Myxococcota bacterium]|nr:hypothetical protein [Myxococcota bacterium]
MAGHYTSATSREGIALDVEGIRIEARSLGGIATTLAFPEWSLCVDLGICTPAALRCRTVALTHGHGDHLAGLLKYLSVRRLYGMAAPTLVVPRGMEEGVEALVTDLGRLQSRPYERQTIAVEIGGEVPLGQGLWLRSFPVAHRQPATGWLVVRRTRRLREAFRDLPGAEIARLRAAGEEDVLMDTVEVPLVAVTGDTSAEVDLSRDPGTVRARVLVLEATFWGEDEERGIQAAALGQHLHSSQLAGVIRGVEARALVLYHLSQVHSVEEVRERLPRVLPPEWLPRTRIIEPLPEDRL